MLSLSEDFYKEGEFFINPIIAWNLSKEAAVVFGLILKERCDLEQKRNHKILYFSLDLNGIHKKTKITKNDFEVAINQLINNKIIYKNKDGYRINDFLILRYMRKYARTIR